MIFKKASGYVKSLLLSMIVASIVVLVFLILLFCNGVNPFDIDHFIPNEIDTVSKKLQDVLDVERNKSLRADSLRNVAWAYGAIAGLYFAVVGIFNSIYRTHQKEVELQQSRRIADSELFSNAVKKLGEAEPEIQIGGLFELDFLAKLDIGNPNSDDSLPIAIKNTIASFIRIKSNLKKEDEKAAIEIAAVILSRTFNEISNREIKTEEMNDETFLLNLRGAKFRNCQFPSEMKFSDFDLTSSEFSNCNLPGADFYGSNLHGVTFDDCNIQRAKFKNTDMTSCQFRDCLLNEMTELPSGVTNIHTKNDKKNRSSNNNSPKKTNLTKEEFDKVFSLVIDYAPNAKPSDVRGIIRYCGLALSTRDGRLVACSDESEISTIATGFCQKKLGLRPEVALDSVKLTCEKMKRRRFKDRVTFYYLLAEQHNKLHLFDLSATTPPNTI